MSPLGIPSASAAPQDDIWTGINNKHKAAVQRAKAMAFNNGRPGSPGTFAATTTQLLDGQGYFRTRLER